MVTIDLEVAPKVLSNDQRVFLAAARNCRDWEVVQEVHRRGFHQAPIRVVHSNREVGRKVGQTDYQSPL